MYKHNTLIYTQMYNTLIYTQIKLCMHTLTLMFSPMSTLIHTHLCIHTYIENTTSTNTLHSQHLQHTHNTHTQH
jgi:hypothetical protein